MSEMLFENPLWVGFIGCVFSGIAGFIWLNTMNRAALQVACGLLGLTVILVLVNINVITEREHIEAMLYRVADALGKNDRETVYQAIDPNATPVVMRAKMELPKYLFTEARVTGITSIEVDSRADPAQAFARFNVRVALTILGDKLDIPRFIKLSMRKSGARWLVYDYEHDEPTAGLRFSTEVAPPANSPLDALKRSGSPKLKL